MSEYNDRYENFGVEIHGTSGRAFYFPVSKKSNVYADSDVETYVHENLHGVDNNLGGNYNYGLAMGTVKRFRMTPQLMLFMPI